MIQSPHKAAHRVTPPRRSCTLALTHVRLSVWGTRLPGRML